MHSSRRKSPLWKIPQKDLERVVKNSYTYTNILYYFGYLSGHGSSIKTLKARLDHDQIDYSHIKSASGLKKLGISRSKNSNNIFVEGRKVSSLTLKVQLLERELLEYRCYGEECSVRVGWNGAFLVLHLDHINGNPLDNKVENLRLLCPNCHSQTTTYSGGNVKKRTSPRYDRLWEVLFELGFNPP